MHSKINMQAMRRIDDVNKACLLCQRWIMHRCTVCVYCSMLCLQLCGMKTKDYELSQPMICWMFAEIYEKYTEYVVDLFIMTWYEKVTLNWMDAMFTFFSRTHSKDVLSKCNIIFVMQCQWCSIMLGACW